MRYLRRHFNPNSYIFYSGSSSNQVKTFISYNRGYHDFDSLFNAPNTRHAWYQDFNEDEVEDDGEAASAAMGLTATGAVMVFGAIEHQTLGRESYFHMYEIPRLQSRMHSGDVTAIHHMMPNARGVHDVMAIEDIHGNIRYINGYRRGDRNASRTYGQCRRRSQRRGLASKPEVFDASISSATPLVKRESCDYPVIHRKRSTSRCRRGEVSAAKGAKGARGAKGAKGAKGAQGEACELKPKETPKKTPQKTPKKTPKKTHKKTPKKTPKKTAPKKKTHKGVPKKAHRKLKMSKVGSF
jgi:hypothetical protein